MQAKTAPQNTSVIQSSQQPIVVSNAPPINDRQSFSLGAPLKPHPNSQSADLQNHQSYLSPQICRDYVTMH